MLRQSLKWCLAALLLASCTLPLLGSHVVPPVYTISTKIDLPAGPEASWRVLVDMSSYSEWNPYLPEVKGALEPGEQLTLTLQSANFEGPLKVNARVGEVSPPQQFYWAGRVGLPGLFDTKHVFKLSQSSGDTTTLSHYEEFRGVIAALLPNRAERSAKTRAAFESMNSALRSEIIRRRTQQDE